MGIFRVAFGGVTAAALALFSAPLWACSPERASLRGAFGNVDFAVEVARSAAEQARGLMFREQLGTFEGMIFVYDSPRETAFWMRNTLIPLDILFFDHVGRLITIHAQAVPLDETPIPSNGPSQFVLEINGGLAARLGVTVGAELQHPEIAQNTALWKCD